MTLLSFFDEASDEIEQERRWYHDRSLAAEASFLRELDHAVESVLDSPVRWPKHIAGTRRYVFPTFPFSLVYFVDREVVAVVALAHHSRRPGYWRRRLR
ncbi:MAG TPA: type II toxin-antitoxin system RelE/ParE family toxin [Thermoanaerobaculia bacterium]|nr:type II toxin-antitoxin system RelE/ParE family toxin [Thermoanaerobaculia bacterium]